MVADVYSSDNAVPRSLSSQTVQFRIVADADADVLLRVAAHLRLGNVAPSAGVLATLDNNTVTMSFVIAGLSSSTVDSIRRKLEQISTVQQVEVQLMPVQAL